MGCDLNQRGLGIQDSQFPKHIAYKPISSHPIFKRVVQEFDRATMSLPMHLRSYREKSKDEITRDMFNVPLQESVPIPSDPPSIVKVRHKEGSGVGACMQGGEINAVLSVEGKEEVYVSLGRLSSWSADDRCS